jgi:hypothetical protein
VGNTLRADTFEATEWAEAVQVFEQSSTEATTFGLRKAQLTDEAAHTTMRQLKPRARPEALRHSTSIRFSVD